MIPAIDPTSVGLTGLLWLFLSYGYALYYASNLISEGSELLLLIPSMAGLVGGVVLPLLGAVPDGAIILFSGLGSFEDAQETLSVGVGALAGSTIMLLTVPLFLSVYAGRVDISAVDGTVNYFGKPKLSHYSSIRSELANTGVTLSEAVNHGGVLMALTTLPYFLIQGPALFLRGGVQDVAKGEHWYALAGLLLCLTGLTVYMMLQLKLSREGEDRDKRMAVMKKLLKKGQVSLSGAIASNIREVELMLAERRSGEGGPLAANAVNDYQTLDDAGRASQGLPPYPPPAVAEYLKEVLMDAFRTYDANNSGHLDRQETFVFFRDFHEAISEDEMNRLFDLYDADKSGFICLDEFIGLSYSLIKAQEARDDVNGGAHAASHARAAPAAVQDASAVMAESAFAEVEEEEVPEEFTSLSPHDQQAAIRNRAFMMLSIGTALVLLFSDPMVSVMQAIANRAGLSPFYVSFVLAPLASNASEVISSMYYASKKTRKTITVSLSTLEGAACLNNTFCLSIFMGLIFFRGLAWQYSAETVAILAVEFVVAWVVQSKTMTVAKAFLLLCAFPLSLILVASLEAIGFD